jgi:hypothetical protein
VSTPAVTVAPSLHAGLTYFVLSHLDLGRDAASLYTPRPETPAWVPDLLGAYHAAPHRLAVHFAPLHTTDLIALFAWLDRPPPPLDTPGDRRLCERLFEALEAETAAFEARWSTTRASEDRRHEVAGALDALCPLMEALWARRDQAPPALVVLDAPALRGRGRGWATSARQRVATSLSEPLEHVVCQVLHEAIHPVSDRELSPSPTTDRDTRLGAPGFAVHQGLEAHAVAVGEALVEAHAPALVSSYARWRQRVGVPPTG